jgi:tetratricopeptide (TPR) repeat protein
MAGGTGVGVGGRAPPVENVPLLKSNAAKLPHEALVEAGYNVVPVDVQKRPLAPQYRECYERHCPELGRLFEDKSVKKKQTGLALLGRVNPHFPDKILVIVDVDDPQKFPEEARRLLDGTWHWRTGPRCPADGDKHNIACEGGICRHRDHQFRLEEALRGEAYAVLVPAEAEKLVKKGVAKSQDGAVELRIRGYQLLPPSLHPSGAIYGWILSPWQSGEFRHPKELSLEEFKRLVETLGLAEERPQGAQQAAERPRERPRGWRRDLSESDVRKIVELLKSAYRPGHRQNIALYLSGWLAKAGVPPETAAKIVQLLHAETNDEDPLGQRLGAVVCTYQLAGVADAKERVETALGVHPSGCGERENNIMGKLGLEKELAAALGEDAARHVFAQLDEIIEPPWLRRFELRLTRHCLKRSGGTCVKWLRAKRGIETVKLELVSKGKKSPADEELAVLPLYMARAYDPFYGEEYLVAFYRRRLIAAAPASEYDAFLNAVRQTPPFYVVKSAQVLDVLKRYMARVKAVVSAGLTEEGGVVDPHRALDAADYGPEPLIQAYRWIRLSYGERNAQLAWLNVMFVFAKLMTPLVRRRRPVFTDLIVYNYGRGGEGKTALVRHVLAPLLGGEQALEKYHVRIDGAVKTEAQLRNLLDLNRLPLLLDEQTRQALERNVPVVLSAVVGLGVTGVHAARRGHGIETRFRNLRGIVLFTNVPFREFLSKALREASDYALARRFLVLAWDSEQIRPEAFRSLPEIRPILGYAARLWQKYREELAQAADLLELVERLADAMEREHPDDPEVREMAEFTRRALALAREEGRVEKATLSDAAALVQRAYQFAMEELKATQVTAIKVLRLLLENPQAAGLAFIRPRNRFEEQRVALERALERLRELYVRPADGGMPDDAATVYAALNRKLEEGEVAAVLFARSKLVPGVPREFLGAQISMYTNPYTKQREHGYALPLARLVELFIETSGEEEPTDEFDSEKTGGASGAVVQTPTRFTDSKDFTTQIQCSTCCSLDTRQAQSACTTTQPAQPTPAQSKNSHGRVEEGAQEEERAREELERFIEEHRT